MSQFLNTNQLALSHLNPMTSWKGKTITQITTSIKKNPGKQPVTSNRKNLFLPNPLKIYRREIANPIDMSNCYSRTSLRIDELNRPNGSINNTASTKINGLVNILDNNIPNNKCEDPGTCLIFLSPGENAKRRCRSSGMIKKAYNPANNRSNYFTDSKQYLTSRNKTFTQNQYNYIRVGDSTLIPSPGLAASNVYSPNGFPVCPKFFISSTTFSYQWLDTQYYTVTVPSGYYDINDFNGVLQKTMMTNYHFLVNNNNGSNTFLINLIYNDATNTIQFQFFCYDKANFPASKYSSDLRANVNWTQRISGTGITPPNQGSGVVLSLQFPNNNLFNALGLSSGSFPLNIQNPISRANTSASWSWSNYTSNYTTTQVYNSGVNPGLKTVYNKIYYKPNNPQFAQQGAVSSSSLINRIKYDTINTAAYKTSGNIFGATATKAYGGNIANALAYGVSENPYTMKDKIGYPNISYPSFLPGSNIQRNCMEKSING